MEVRLHSRRRFESIAPMSTLFAFLHHLAAFTLVGALAAEFILVGQELSHATAKRLVLADSVLGAAAVVLFVVGLSRVFFFEKGETYYFHSYAFMTKLSVFIAVAILSITPTIEFLSWRDTLKAGQVPKVDPKKMAVIKKIIHGELAAVVIIVLCAAIMARGGWV
jgi:putative membrane protein